MVVEESTALTLRGLRFRGDGPETRHATLAHGTGVAERNDVLRGDTAVSPGQGIAQESFQRDAGSIRPSRFKRPTHHARAAARLATP